MGSKTATFFVSLCMISQLAIMDFNASGKQATTKMGEKHTNLNFSIATKKFVIQTYQGTYLQNELTSKTARY